MKKQNHWEDGMYVAIIVLVVVFLALLPIIWADTNPIYAKSCSETNFTHLPVIWGAFDPNAGATLSLIGKTFSVDCMKSICIYHPETIHEDYREEACG